MPWKPGQSGNPKGRLTEKVFADTLRIVMRETDEASGKLKLRRIVEKLAEAAIEGQSWAIQQVADRLDGKPAQESTLTLDRRDVKEWTRDELLDFLNDARANAKNGGRGAVKANGSDEEPNSVH
jgi:Family of unknown function (DUF5681)